MKFVSSDTWRTIFRHLKLGCRELRGLQHDRITTAIVSLAKTFTLREFDRLIVLGDYNRQTTSGQDLSLTVAL